ncbi:Uncharacterised protein [Campylobacter lari]|nr:Uncharacterised protein [Campylobacter lari]
MLSFYLASWGMYRGSSFLLRYDYKIYKTILEELLAIDLWDKHDWNQITKANEIIEKNYYSIEIIKKIKIIKIKLAIR